MGQIYKFLGLTVGVIVHGLDDEQRKTAMTATSPTAPTTNSGFDYLRDNMKYPARGHGPKRGHIYAIVDEVDSILTTRRARRWSCRAPCAVDWCL